MFKKLTILIQILLYSFSIPPVFAQTDQLAPIPVHDLMKSPLVSDVKISPDGQSVAALYNNNDRIMVLVKDLTTDNSEPTVINVLNHNVKWVEWANNNRIIAGTVVEGGIWHDFYMPIVMDKGGKNMRHLISDLSACDRIYLLPGDPDHVLVEERNAQNLYYPEVYKVSVGNRKSEQRIQESRLNIEHWIIDANGDIKMGYGYLADGMIIDAKMADGSWKTIKKNRYLIDPWMTPLAIGKTGNAYVLSYHETDKAALYEYNIETQSFVRLLYKHEQVDVSDIYYSKLKDTVEYVGFTVDAPELHFFDEQLARDYNAVSQALPGATNMITSRSSDEKRMIIFSSGSNNPGSYYLFDRENKKLKYLGSRYPDIEKRTLSKIKGVSYKARDGMTIYGYVSSPEGYGNGPYPLAVLVHGGPYARDKNQFDAWVQFLTSRGYVVFQPTFRGSTGYGNTYWKSGYRQFGLAMEDDIIDGVKVLIEDKVVDPARICIMGASYGGYAAQMGVVKYPDMFRCAISIEGISDLNRYMIQKGNYINRLLIGDDYEERKAVSPITYAEKITCPVFLAHGTEDKNVYYSQSENMYDALKKTNKDVTFLTLKNETHHLEDVKNRMALFEAIDDFLEKYMGKYKRVQGVEGSSGQNGKVKS
jgi:dipeptidyl aminopeptidase/acylaminoacyl peptidase